MKQKCVMLFKKRKCAMLIYFLLLFTCSYLTYINYGNELFLSAKLTDVLTIIIGFIVAVFITERLTDFRRRNDCIEHIIVEIENFVTDDSNFTINKSTLIKQGSCANRIKYLKDANFRDISEDINFIDTNFQNIRDLYSNHNQNDSCLSCVKVDMDKHRSNIVDKCSKIRVSLYS